MASRPRCARPWRRSAPDRQARGRSRRRPAPPEHAVDDFGTGYSSLGYLRRFPVDILKIAREFVVPSDRDADEWAFAHAIVALGHTLGLRIIAEGIEEAAQADRLRGLGCELGQGFFFARPVEAGAIEAAMALERPAVAGIRFGLEAARPAEVGARPAEVGA